jgi:hypothetical protein
MKKRSFGVVVVSLTIVWAIALLAIFLFPMLVAVIAVWVAVSFTNRIIFEGEDDYE